MNKKQLVIFSFILVFILSIGSTYAFGEEQTEPRKQHTLQRKIDRELQQPSDASPRFGDSEENKVE